MSWLVKMELVMSVLSLWIQNGRRTGGRALAGKGHNILFPSSLSHFNIGYPSVFLPISMWLSKTVTLFQSRGYRHATLDYASQKAFRFSWEPLISFSFFWVSLMLQRLWDLSWLQIWLSCQIMSEHHLKVIHWCLKQYYGYFHLMCTMCHIWYIVKY